MLIYYGTLLNHTFRAFLHKECHVAEEKRN